MSRFLEIAVQAPGSVGQVLRGAGFSKKEISRAKFIPEGIRNNGVRCRVTDKVMPGDLVQICLEEEGEDSCQLEERDGEPVILYEDRDLLAVYKAPGIVTHPRGGHYGDTLANQIVGYFRRKGESHSVRPVGRLDRETSGVVIFAKNQISAARLQRQREEGRFRKTYLAVVMGEMERDGLLHRMERPIGTDSENRLKMCIDEIQGKYACTEYQVLESKDGISLVQVQLGTGRTHQIRVHMASLGHPLAGDQLYGADREKNPLHIHRAALHAWKTCLEQPVTGEQIEIDAPLPRDMKYGFEFFRDMSYDFDFYENEMPF